MEFCDFLKKSIDERGMTQADVARKSGLSTAIVAQVFSGKTKSPGMRVIIPITRAIGLSAEEVFSAYERTLDGGGCE